MHLSFVWHGVPSTGKGMGHRGLVPVHDVGGLHTASAPTLHTKVDGWYTSAGQSPEVPVQVSGTSHGLALRRQADVFDWKASAGQRLELPSQISVTSQPPLASLHTEPADLRASKGHEELVPAHVYKY